MTQPQINDVNIPYPSATETPSFDEGYRGSGRELADGSVVFDFVTSTRKRLWKLTWKNISAANMEILRTAHNTVLTQNSTKWEPDDGGTYYVTADPQDAEIHIKRAPKAGTVPKYDVSLSLREV